ncbi:NAD(P)/FAD-dependent oxidoreductase [Nocardia brasiliensis]
MSGANSVVVLGAGIIGSSIALRLAERGYEVVVVDKAGGPGMGSTSASSAVIRFNYSTSDGVVTAWESYKCWQKFGAYLSLPDDVPVARYHQTGVVLLDVEIAPRAQFTRLFDRVGIPYEEWSSADLAERISGIDAGKYYPPKPITSDAFYQEATGQLGALYTPDGGFVDDPRLAAANFAVAAIRAGAKFRYHSTVVELAQEPTGRWRIRLADGVEFRASIVVNAGGPWSGKLNRLAGVGADFTMSVAPMRQEVHRVAAPAQFNDAQRPGPCVADLDLGIFLRSDGADGILVGGTEPKCDPLEWIDDPDTANPNCTVERFEAQITRAARRFPDLGVPSRPKGIAGVYDVTTDWAPIYDKTDKAGFYVAMGTSGNQFKNAPLVGEYLATIIDEVEAGADHDLRPVQYIGRSTGIAVNLGAYSRKRAPNKATSGTVLG